MKKSDRQRLDRLAQSGCVVCRNMELGESPAAIHHLIGHQYRGLSQRASHQQTIPLCHFHHQGQQGIHTIGMRIWEQQFGTQTELLEQVNQELVW